MSQTVMPAPAGVPHRESDPSIRRGDGRRRDGLSASTGLLTGIALKTFARAPMIVLERSDITVEAGVVGDYRGRPKPGGKGRRQVTLFERGDWEEALDEIGARAPWWARRCNLMVDALDLPKRAGARLRLGRDALVEVTVECDPCVRMNAVAPGLFAALRPDWRGGVCARVIASAAVALGDEIRIEE